MKGRKSRKEPTSEPIPEGNPEEEKQTVLSKSNVNRFKRQIGNELMSSNNQTKITNFFSASSLSNNTEPPADVDPQDLKIQQLKNQLILKEQEVQKVRTQKQKIEDKLNRLHLENRNYKNKARTVIIKVLKEQAAKKRQERARVDMRLGYFAGDSRNFIDGEEISHIKAFIEDKQADIAKLEGQYKKSKSQEDKNRAKFSIEFLKKQVKKEKLVLLQKEKQQEVYKERLKLAFKEQVCQYSLQGWPMIKDTQGNERYQTLELLGKGGFGQVYKCYDIEENETVAIKINNINLDHGQEAADNVLKHVLREVNTQKELKHENIAQIKQLLELDRKRIVFVLEYCSGPELSVYLKKNKSVEEKDAKQVIYQILAGLNYLFGLDKKVIHYDLKPSNIIFHHGTVKILDFGLCKLMDGEQSRMDLTSPGAGTYWYLPPETFSQYQTKISSKVDVWSTGVIFFQLLYGKRPFANGVSQKAIMQRNLIQVEGQKLVFPDSNPNGYKISKEAKQFMKQLMEYDPDNRLTPKQAFNHPYFNEYHLATSSK